MTECGPARYDCLVLADAWLTRALECLTSSYHAFLWCRPDDLAGLELHLHSRDLPVQSRIVWHHPNVTPQRMSVGLLSTWTPVVHIGIQGLRCAGASKRAHVDVQEFTALDGDTEHLPKPRGLVEWLVGIGSRPGDAVLDLFGGDTSTGDVCQRLGRDCTIIEDDPSVTAALHERFRREQDEPDRTTTAQ